MSMSACPLRCAPGLGCAHDRQTATRRLVPVCEPQKRGNANGTPRSSPRLRNYLRMASLARIRALQSHAPTGHAHEEARHGGCCSSLQNGHTGATFACIATVRGAGRGCASLGCSPYTIPTLLGLWWCHACRCKSLQSVGVGHSVNSRLIPMPCRCISLVHHVSAARASKPSLTMTRRKANVCYETGPTCSGLSWRLTCKIKERCRLPRMRLLAVSKRGCRTWRPYLVLPSPKGSAVLDAFALYHIDHASDRHFWADLPLDRPRELNV